MSILCIYEEYVSLPRIKETSISPKDENGRSFVPREWLCGVSTFFASPLYKSKRFLNGVCLTYHIVANISMGL